MILYSLWKDPRRASNPEQKKGPYGPLLMVRRLQTPLQSSPQGREGLGEEWLITSAAQHLNIIIIASVATGNISEKALKASFFHLVFSLCLTK